MATPSSSQPIALPPRTEGWGRKGESGSAFRGLDRGARSRGRGGSRGRGRAASSGNPRGRGQGESSAEKSIAPSVKSETPIAPKTAVPATAPIPAPPKSSVPPVVTPSKPKTTSRRASRTIPAATIAPSAPSGDAPPATAPTRPSNRRRRSTTIPNKTPSITVSKSNAPAVPEPVKASASMIKDPPPHVTAPFDMRTNIDALVERVRAVAMENNRPTTPGSHIDWAGDDDDSLPDLDDWGVTTSTSAGPKETIMSPLMVEGLKTLPEPIAKVMTPQPGEIPLPNGNNVAANNSTAPPSEQKTAPLHPSLPPKPVAAMEAALLNARGATPMRGNIPPKSPLKTEVALESSSEKTPVQETIITVPVTALDPVVENAVSMEKPAREGLAASIHAPTVLSDSLSAPSDLTHFASPPTGPPRAFTPTHGRAHTVGVNRPSSRHPDDRSPKSAMTSPRAGYGNGGYHSRTHSTPPTGSPGRRAPHATRPILTGAALSTIAKTIGRALPARPAGVAAKE